MIDFLQRYYCLCSPSAEGNNSGLTHRKQGYGSSGEGSGSTTETTRSTPVNAGTWNSK